jgi:phage baseplate assembly protein W
MTTETARFLGQGIAFPPRIGADGRLAWSAGEPNVRENIEVVLRTEPGERLRLADFGAGLRRFLFEPATTATRAELGEQIRRAITDWEPRVTVLRVDVDPDSGDPDSGGSGSGDPDPGGSGSGGSGSGDGNVAVVTIVYRLVATRVEHRLVASVALGG